MNFYDAGFRAGYLDALNDLRLRVALMSGLRGYATGYYDGQLAARQKLMDEK